MSKHWLIYPGPMFSHSDRYTSVSFANVLSAASRTFNLLDDVGALVNGNFVLCRTEETDILILVADNDASVFLDVSS